MRFSNPLDLHAIALAFPQVRFIMPQFGAGMFREALMLADLCRLTGRAPRAGSNIIRG